MKHGRILRLFALVLAAVLPVCAAAPSAFAAGAKKPAPDGEQETQVDFTVNPGDTWDEAVAAFIEHYENKSLSHSLALGYCNLVTGEEHYYQGDEYMVACSMYKVPLNMLFAEKIYNGEMDWDTEIANIPYSELMERSIVNSYNEPSEYLFRELGGYWSYRVAISEYMGVDPYTVDDRYFENNYFTAEQEIHCLTTLYEGGERFPGILDAMRKAEPDEYFNHHEQPYPLAHKYGILRDTTDGRKTYVNDSAIVYTDEPIAIVMFTFNVPDAKQALADYCTLMCEYTQQNLSGDSETKK